MAENNSELVKPTVPDPTSPKPPGFFSDVLIFQNKKNRSISDWVKILVVKSIAVLFWLYVVTTILFFSVDSYVLDSLPARARWLLAYKFVGILLFTSLAWVVLGTKNFAFSASYILFYPIIKVGEITWRVSFAVFRRKSWIVVFALIDFLATVGKSIKRSFLLLSLFVVSAVCISVSNSQIALAISGTLIFFMVIAAYVSSFKSALSPSKTFNFIRELFDRDDDTRYKSLRLDEDIRGKPLAQLSPDQLTKWNNGLQNSVIYNRSLLFYAKTLRDYQRSNLPFLPGMISIFWLASFTVISFSLISFAAYWYDHNLYAVNGPATPFKFIFYSFNALVLNGVDDIKPVRPLSQFLVMAQEFLSFVLAAILISLFMSYRAQRSSSDLDEAIKGAEREAASVETWMQNEYRMESIGRAIDHLKQAEAAMLKFIHWLSRGI